MFDRNQLVTLQAALRVACNSYDEMAAIDARVGDREALSGNINNRAEAYHTRAAGHRQSSADCFALMPMITEAVLAGDTANDHSLGTFDTRLLIGELTRACVILGEVRVKAAGSIYATIETDEIARKQLTSAKITWVRD